MIPDTTTEAGQIAASVMLAELCGWRVSCGLIDSDRSGDGFAHDVTTITLPDGTWTSDSNLYDPTNMALAWRVLNFAVASPTIGASFDVWWVNDLQVHQLRYVPAAAQRTWLDKILSMAIEAGMVQK